MSDLIRLEYRNVTMRFTQAASELTAVQRELNDKYPNANGKRTVGALPTSKEACWW